MIPPSTKPPVVESIEPLSPHSKAVLQAGEQLVLESVETGRQFCKAMVGASFTAIPVYAGLLKLFIHEGANPSRTVGYSWIIPVLLFVLSATVAAGGHLPGRRSLSLEVLEELEAALRQAILRRYWCGVASFALFSFGVIASVAILASA